MSAIETLPRWDLTSVYPSLESPQFKRDRETLVQEIVDLSHYFAEHHIGAGQGMTVDAETVDMFETIMSRMAAMIEQLRTLASYLSCTVSADTGDVAAQARLSELQRDIVPFTQVNTRFVAWIGSLDVEALIARSTLARDHAYMLRRARESAQHLMSQPEEDLASELNLTGGVAWTRLHSDVSSQLLVQLEVNGEQRSLPMSEVRNLATDPDREIRRTAYEAELGAWERVAVPMAAAINSVKGQTNTLDNHRGWSSALDVALFNNDIDRQTLDAMMAAARAAFPDFRRYLHAKARVLGLERLAWYDLAAPVGQSARQWAFDDAVDFMLEQFGSYSPRLRSLAERAIGEHWIDAEPRPGKVGGAFCSSIRPGESRILANFHPSYDSMSTLAHELGHAYHNFNLASRTPFQRDTPMTVAETASIFNETIVQNAALGRSDPHEQLLILEAALQGETQIVVDISARFLFESTLFEARRQRVQSVDELNHMMLEAERDTYGDGVDDNTLHPYMWAVKGHYYSAGYPYYNFPYMFGLLFGLGLYARYDKDPEEFKSQYDDLLSSTGLANAADLASRFGIDIRTQSFWESSLDVIRGNIDRFVNLAETETS